MGKSLVSCSFDSWCTHFTALIKHNHLLNDSSNNNPECLLWNVIYWCQLYGNYDKMKQLWQIFGNKEFIKQQKHDKYWSNCIKYQQKYTYSAQWLTLPICLRCLLLVQLCSWKHNQQTPTWRQKSLGIAVWNKPHCCRNSHAIRDHSVTCHLAEVTLPPLPQPKLVYNLAASEGCKAELT